MSKVKPTSENMTEVPGWKGKFWLGPNHTYWWMDTPDGTPKALSGITSVLGVIAKPALVQWAANMAVDYIKTRLESLGGDIGSEDLSNPHTWKGVEIILDEGRYAHNKKKEDAADAGHDAHALIEEYIKACIKLNDGVPWTQVTSPDPRVGEFATWAVSRYLDKQFRFLDSEIPLADVKLAIAGTPDFIAEEHVLQQDGQLKMLPLIGDLKTGSGVYDRTFFAQMAAYGYMWMKRNRSKVPPSLLVVHAPSKKPDQPIATYYSDDFRGDWDGFRAALTIHRWKDNFSRPKWKKP